MKVSLVVAAGVHQGKVIPIVGTQFLIGRDPHCQLRPASQAISKQHCGVFLRDGKVFVKDYGSTNGTFVNDEPVPADSEREVQPNDRLRAGPLDFTVQIAPPKPSDSTPLPDSLRSVGSGAVKPAPKSNPAQPPAAKAGGSGAAVPAARPGAGSKPAVKPVSAAAAKSADDDIAAMLLGMGDDDQPAEVPGGSTVFEMPAVNPDGTPKTTDPKSGETKKAAVASREDTSNAASDILRRYMRRPR